MWDKFKELAESWTQVIKVQEAVRIAIFPPWRIKDIEAHTGVNITALTITSLVFYFTRQFTRDPLYGIEPAFIGAVVSSVFLVGSGIVINALDPTQNAARLTNRWSTFLIISFFYELLAVAIIIGVLPLIFNLRQNPLDLLSIPLGSYELATGVFSLFIALCATGFLFWRAIHLFRNILKYSRMLTVLYFTLCVLLNFGLLYLFVFILR